jgi:hypothetical protein
VNLRPTLDPHPSASITDIATRLPFNASPERAFANHQAQQRAAHRRQLDDLAAACVAGNNVLHAVNAELARFYELADETDFDSGQVRRAIVLRMSQMIMGHLYPDHQGYVPADMGGAS